MSSAPSVRPVRTPRDLRRFIDLPYRLHRHDPQWVAPLRMDVATLLSRAKNPFFEHGAAEYFLAEDARGDAVGRIAAIRNDAHTRLHEDERHVGFFGFFDAVNAPAVAAALFDAAGEWLRRQGLGVLRGPASFSTNDECGLLVDGFDTPPCIMMPHNPRYYPALVEGAGFTKAMDLVAYDARRTEPPADLASRAANVAARFGVTLRTIDMGRFWSEVDRIQELYNAAWEKNWGFVPMTDAEIKFMAKQLKPVIVPELVVFAEREGKLIGLAIAIPDFNQALRHNPSGRLFPTGLLRVLWHKRGIRRTRVLTLGVLKDYRRMGADALLVDSLFRNARALGYIDGGEAGWVLETNALMRNGIERVGLRPYKTYRMYDKAL